MFPHSSCPEMVKACSSGLSVLQNLIQSSSSISSELDLESTIYFRQPMEDITSIHDFGMNVVNNDLKQNNETASIFPGEHTSLDVEELNPTSSITTVENVNISSDVMGSQSMQEYTNKAGILGKDGDDVQIQTTELELEAECKEAIMTKNSKGSSIAEFLAAEQIREHLSSFRQCKNKEKLSRKKNDEEIEEAWVRCDKCEHWQHQICVLYNGQSDPDGKEHYTCPKCCLKELENGHYMPGSKAAVFDTKDLLKTKLSDHIEKRIFKCLQQERKKRAKGKSKNSDEVPRVEDLVVRVVHSVDRILKVNEAFLDLFNGNSYPSEFPYKSKAILLFQKIGGVDVCLFSMCVQEFGSECSQPNQRSVYISYLDSVKYFTPDIESMTDEPLRTVVYHQILIGYLDFVKRRCFTKCHIWACPPLKGEDYIFNYHPKSQRTPKSDKLWKWYKSMLQKAAEDKVVVNYSNIHEQFFVPTGECNSKITAARLPYFEGYHCSNVAEDILKKIENESSSDSEKKTKKPVTKRLLKAMRHTRSSDCATKIL